MRKAFLAAAFAGALVAATTSTAATGAWATGTDPDSTHEPLLNVAGL